MKLKLIQGISLQIRLVAKSRDMSLDCQCYVFEGGKILHLLMQFKCCSKLRQVMQRYVKLRVS